MGKVWGVRRGREVQLEQLDVVAESFEEGEKGRRIFFAPALEQDLEPLTAALDDLVDDLTPGGRQGEQLGAPVVGVADLVDQPDLDEVADLAAYGGDIGVDELGERRDPAWLVGQGEEDGEVRVVDVLEIDAAVSRATDTGAPG